MWRSPLIGRTAHSNSLFASISRLISVVTWSRFLARIRSAFAGPSVPAFGIVLVLVAASITVFINPAAAVGTESDPDIRAGAIELVSEAPLQPEPPVPDTIDPFESEDPIEEVAVLDVAGLELDAAALVAVDFNPWLLTDADIPVRRDVVVANRLDKTATRDAAARELATAQRSFDDAEAVRLEAQRRYDELETKMEKFSITMWVLGDDGLQEEYGSEYEAIQQAQPIRTATSRLIERFEEAGAQLTIAEDLVAIAADALEAAQAVFGLADSALDRAVQVEQNFESKVSVRNNVINRWTHEVLVEERDEVSLVRVQSILVRTIVEPPIDPAAAVAGSDGSASATGAAASGANQVAGDGSVPAAETAATVEPVYEENVVRISPILVNAEVAGRVASLLGAAWSDGVELGGGGYRDRESQILLRRAHCGSSGYAIFEMPAGECSPPTARPGRSQHELGLAIDFTQNGAILSSGSAGFAWMQAHAAEYGFFNLPSEAWHWSTTGS